METSGIGGTVYELRKKIQELNAELNQLGDPTPEIPELVSSANALRSCEFLQKQNDKQKELLKVYTQYSKSLDGFLSTVFEIQNDLKDIIREQALMLSEIDSAEESSLEELGAKDTKAKTTKAKTTKAKAKSSTK